MDTLYYKQEQDYTNHMFTKGWSYVHTYELLYLGNGTSDHRNEKTKTLCNTKYPPKPRKTHLRNHFWPLESGFSAIATYKTYVFSKSPNVPILKFFLVIPDTFSIPKSLTEVMEDFFSLKTRSRPMWVPTLCCSSGKPQVKSTDTTKNLRWINGFPDSPYLVLEAFSEPVTIMLWSVYATPGPHSPDCYSFK